MAFFLYLNTILAQLTQFKAKSFCSTFLVVFKGLLVTIIAKLN